jgi:hypothetical protein
MTPSTLKWLGHKNMWGIMSFLEEIGNHYFSYPWKPVTLTNRWDMNKTENVSWNTSEDVYQKHIHVWTNKKTLKKWRSIGSDDNNNIKRKLQTWFDLIFKTFVRYCKSATAHMPQAPAKAVSNFQHLHDGISDPEGAGKYNNTDVKYGHCC